MMPCFYSFLPALGTVCMPPAGKTLPCMRLGAGAGRGHGDAGFPGGEEKGKEGAIQGRARDTPEGKDCTHLGSWGHGEEKCKQQAALAQVFMSTCCCFAASSRRQLAAFLAS